MKIRVFGIGNAARLRAAFQSAFSLIFFKFFNLIFNVIFLFQSTPFTLEG